MKNAHLTIPKSAQIILTMIFRISNAIKPKLISYILPYEYESSSDLKFAQN